MSFLSSTKGYGAGKELNSGFVTINGRRVSIGNGVYGRELSSFAGSGRRAVKIDGCTSETINPLKLYGAADLTDKHGRPVKIVTIPDRTKGGMFPGQRDAYSRGIILEQIADVGAKFAREELSFDEENADWVVFPHFRLPPAWGVKTSPMLIVFPREYPSTPPIGFYLPSHLNSPNGHFFGQVYHGAHSAPTQEGWNWYCCTVNQGAWQPYPARQKGEWLYGDNLWTYITLINEILASPENAA